MNALLRDITDLSRRAVTSLVRGPPRQGLMNA